MSRIPRLTIGIWDQKRNIYRKITSIILAQKLASVKLTKAEFEKVKQLRATNLYDQLEINGSLQYVLQTQIINKICRLCLKSGTTQIFHVDNEFDFAGCIKRILAIEVFENDGKPQHLCEACETVLRCAEELKQTADITQWRLQQELEMVEISAGKTVAKRRFHGSYFVREDKTVVREWGCGKCTRTFTSQKDFTAHEELPSCRSSASSSNGTYICEICGHCASSLPHFNVHRLTHTSEYPFSCSHCSFRTRTKYRLVYHLRSHIGLRPLKCELCPAKFARASNPSAHKTKHFPPQYQCQICDRKFRLSQGLQNHIPTHSSERPFTCKLCGKTFAIRKNLYKHEQNTHKRPSLHPVIKHIPRAAVKMESHLLEGQRYYCQILDSEEEEILNAANESTEE